MTDIEKKARALLDEVKRVKNLPGATYTDAYRALCRAIEQHEAFRLRRGRVMVPRKGSQAVTRACITSATSLAYRGRNVCHPPRADAR